MHILKGLLMYWVLQLRETCGCDASNIGDIWVSEHIETDTGLKFIREELPGVSSKMSLQSTSD